MTKKAKIILDLLGVFAGISGVAALVISELYLLAAFSFLSAAIFGTLVYIHFNREQLKWLSTHTYHVLNDEHGKDADITKINRFIPSDKNITTLVDRQMSASGKLENFSSSLGSVTEVQDEGGTISVITSINFPLKIGKQTEHCIKYKAIDSFTEEKESVAHSVRFKLKEAGLSVKFPDKRKPMSVAAYRIIGEYPELISDIAISQDRSEASIVECNLPVGSKLVLQWTW